jgi:thiamine biosynthesis lipoprotein
VRVDPGAIGKGLAADLVVSELLARGALGALVDVGGDIRAAGRAPTPDGWVVAVEDPWDPAVEIARFAVADGGVATSSVVRQRWRVDGAPMHHVIDPRTGAPAGTDLASATVVAGEAWWAEALATAALVSGRERAVRLLGEARVSAVLVTAAGEVVPV